MANGFGVPLRTPPLRGLTVQPSPDRVGPLLQGLFGFAEAAEQRTERQATQRREDARTKQTLALGRMSQAVKLLENKNLPSTMKVQIWNETLAPAFDALKSGPGSAVGPSLGRLTEWPNAMDPFMKRARVIIDDKKLGAEDTLKALSALQVEAGDDIDLAPLIERGKERQTRDFEQDVHRAEVLLGADGVVTDEESDEWSAILARNPSAPGEAASRIEKRGLLPTVGAAPRVAMGGAFDPEGSSFDEATARAAGMTRDEAGHMGSVIEAPDEMKTRLGLPAESFLVLKGRRHPTFDKAVAAEEARGFKIVKAGNRYFSVPKGTGDIAGPAPHQMTPAMVQERSAVDPTFRVSAGKPVTAVPAAPATAAPADDLPLELKVGREKATTLEIDRLDAEIKDLLGPGGRRLGRQAREQRINQLQQERARLITERERREGRLAPTRSAQEIALAEFDGPFEELTQEQRQIVRNIGRDERLAESAARGAGVEAEKRRSDFSRLALFTTEGVQQLDSILTTLQQQPEAFGASGAVAATVLGVADQIVNFGQLFGLSLSVDEKVARLLDRGRDFAGGFVDEQEFVRETTAPFEATFRDIGITNRRLQSQMIGLATTLAAQEAIRGRGRLTEEGVRRQLERIGERTQSPQAFAETLLNVRQEIVARLGAFKRIMLKGEVPTIGPPPVQPRQSQPKPAPPTRAPAKPDDIEILRRRPAR